jgi:rhamnogalacturonan endolyase
MNHGDYPWDVIRTGFHGPYIFTFADSLPHSSLFNYTILENLGLNGYLGDSKRGKVVGKASGTSGDFPIVVHWYNENYQQWAYADSDGSFKSPLLSPGSYTQAFYQDELLAGTTTVAVKAGATATASMTATNPIITGERTNIFQIGDYDGRPVGLLNADKQQRMHVSDARMEAWDTSTYIVGTSSVSQFPMAIFMDINNDREIEFALDSDLTTVANFRVGTTLSFYWGKPTVKVNNYTCAAFTNPNGSGGRGITKVDISSTLQFSAMY